MTVYIDGTRDYPQAMVQPAARRSGTRWCHHWTDGEAEELPILAKDEVAEIILDRVSGIVESGG